MTRAVKPVLLTVAETATVMGISERTVWALIASRDLASVQADAPRGRGTRKLRRIEQAEIDAWIKRHRQPATT